MLWIWHSLFSGNDHAIIPTHVTLNSSWPGGNRLGWTMERNHQRKCHRGRRALWKQNSTSCSCNSNLTLTLFTVFYLPSYVLNICCTTWGVSHEKCPGCHCLYRYNNVRLAFNLLLKLFNLRLKLHYVNKPKSNTVYTGNRSWKKTFTNFVDFGMIANFFLLPFSIF